MREATNVVCFRWCAVWLVIVVADASFFASDPQSFLVTFISGKIEIQNVLVLELSDICVTDFILTNSIIKYIVKILKVQKRYLKVLFPARLNSQRTSNLRRNYFPTRYVAFQLAQKNLKSVVSQIKKLNNNKPYPTK